MDWIALLGRILLVPLFVGGGISHLTKTRDMAAYAQAKGVPQGAARPIVIGSGLMILVGGLMVLLGVWADLGALLLVAFLVPTALVMHAFWKVDDPQAQPVEQAQFMKNLALAGAALLMFVLFTTSEVGLTLTGPLFALDG